MYTSQPVISNMNEFKVSIPTVTSQAIALLRFHLGAGGRLSQRVFLPIFGSFFFLYFLLGPDFFHAFTAALIGGGYFSSAIPTTFFALIVAKIAGQRVAHGLTGWMRHLPVNENTNRRLAIIALSITILPLLSILAFLSIAAAGKYNIRVAPYLLGLPMVGMAAALFALPVKRRYFSKALLALSCLSFSSQDWGLMLAGVILLVGGDMISGPLVPITRRLGFSVNRLIHFILIWRAMRLRLLIPYLLSFTIYPILFLFLVNNPYDYHQANMVIRLAAGMSLTVFCASFTQILAKRRPPWLWSRSLPWSAWQRIYRDALFLMIHLFPLVLVAVIIRGQMMLFIFCCLPGLVIFSVMVSRRISASRFGVAGQVLGQAVLPVFLFGLSPWVSLLYLVLTPWLIQKAAFEEMSLPVSKWLEVSHVAEGDSQSWRGS